MLLDCSRLADEPKIIQISTSFLLSTPCPIPLALSYLLHTAYLNKQLNFS